MKDEGLTTAQQTNLVIGNTNLSQHVAIDVFCHKKITWPILPLLVGLTGGWQAG